jgi:hypothetical protein
MGWLSAGSAVADIIGTTGAIDLLPSAPPSVKIGALQSNTQIFTFNEQQFLTLPSAISVDITAAGSYPPNTLTPGTLAAGTQVESDFLHTDPKNNSSMYDGSVTFSTPILGVIVLSASLNATDSLLGAPGTLYQTGDSERGLELTSGQDSVMVSSDLKTLTVHFFTHGNLDEVRVLTAVTPEPSSIVIAGCGALFLTLAARLRRRRSA